MKTTWVARMVQSCFTKSMPTRTRENIYEKAQRILDDPSRVIESEHSDAPDWWTGQVVGDHGTYSAFAVSPRMAKRIDLGESRRRIGCFCRAGQRGKLCSHAIVAEEMRVRAEDQETGES